MSIEFTSPLRGANFRPQTAKDKVAALASGDLVTLIPEPENPYDANAIQVHYEDEFIGFIAKEIAVTMIDDFNSADTYSAVVDYFIDPLTPVFLIELDHEDDDTADEAA